MVKVTWWLSTKNGDYSSRDLWVREVEMAFLPVEGDQVHILGSEEEPDGSVSTDIRDRLFDLQGNAHLQFKHYVIDPPEDFRPDRIHSSWWTDRDGDFEEQLRYSGWITYAERREQHG